MASLERWKLCPTGNLLIAKEACLAGCIIMDLTVGKGNDSKTNASGSLWEFSPDASMASPFCPGMGIWEAVLYPESSQRSISSPRWQQSPGWLTAFTATSSEKRCRGTQQSAFTLNHVLSPSSQYCQGGLAATLLGLLRPWPLLNVSVFIYLTIQFLSLFPYAKWLAISVEQKLS